MEGNIGAQIIILISFAVSIILAITLGSRILRKARESENQNG